MVRGDGQGRKRYCFGITASARVFVEGVDARQARDDLVLALDGAAARVVGGPGDGMELVDVRVSDDVALLLVDGIDPTAELARALEAFRRRDGEGRE